MSSEERAALPALSCAEVDDLAGAYALAALPDDEAARVAAHLRNRQHCTSDHRDLFDFQEVAALLPLLCDQVEPPPALRHRILAEALQPRAPLRMLPATQATAPRRRTWQLPGLWAAAALLLIAIGLGVWNLQLHGQLHDRYQAGQRAQLQALLAQGKILPLQPQANGQGINASVVLTSDGHAYLAGTLPALQAGKVYELWVIAGGKAQPAGTFAVSAAGAPRGNAAGGSVQLTAPVASGDAVALTAEPSGGSAQPSENPRAIATVG